MLGISKAALSDRRRADTFPEPLAELRCGPIWDRSVIEEHLETFGPSNRRRWSLQRIGRHFESLES